MSKMKISKREQEPVAVESDSVTLKQYPDLQNHNPAVFPFTLFETKSERLLKAKGKVRCLTTMVILKENKTLFRHRPRPFKIPYQNITHIYDDLPSHKEFGLQFMISAVNNDKFFALFNCKKAEDKEKIIDHILQKTARSKSPQVDNYEFLEDQSLRYAKLTGSNKLNADQVMEKIDTDLNSEAYVDAKLLESNNEQIKLESTEYRTQSVEIKHENVMKIFERGVDNEELVIGMKNGANDVCVYHVLKCNNAETLDAIKRAYTNKGFNVINSTPVDVQRKEIMKEGCKVDVKILDLNKYSTFPKDTLPTIFQLTNQEKVNDTWRMYIKDDQLDFYEQDEATQEIVDDFRIPYENVEKISMVESEKALVIEVKNEKGSPDNYTVLRYRYDRYNDDISHFLNENNITLNKLEKIEEVKSPLVESVPLIKVESASVENLNQVPIPVKARIFDMHYFLTFPDVLPEEITKSFDEKDLDEKGDLFITKNALNLIDLENPTRNTQVDICVPINNIHTSHTFASSEDHVLIGVIDEEAKPYEYTLIRFKHPEDRKTLLEYLKEQDKLVKEYEEEKEPPMIITQAEPEQMQQSAPSPHRSGIKKGFSIIKFTDLRNLKNSPVYISSSANRIEVNPQLQDLLDETDEDEWTYNVQTFRIDPTLGCVPDNNGSNYMYVAHSRVENHY